MGSALVVLVLVVVLALAFDYINGFHDTANAVATVVSTNVLPGRTAVLLAAVCNFVGAFVGRRASPRPSAATSPTRHRSRRLVVAAALLGAIFWNLLTWYYGIPSSSSHAADRRAGRRGVVPPGRSRRRRRRALIWSCSPQGRGADAQGARAVAAVRAARRLHPDGHAAVAGAALAPVDGEPQLPRAATGLGRVHGVRARLQRRAEVDGHHHPGAGRLRGVAGADAQAELDVPMWVIVACATAMALGTASGGWRIMKTMGHRIIKLRPINGFAAETRRGDR